MVDYSFTLAKYVKVTIINYSPAKKHSEDEYINSLFSESYCMTVIKSPFLTDTGFVISMNCAYPFNLFQSISIIAKSSYKQEN